MKHPRSIALVDCNNFYASCERVFKPQWRDRPIGVLSNNDGCIVARSAELKAAGIPMGAPYFKVRSQLENIGAVVVSSNYALYGDMSARVMQTLAQFTPEMEVYSIDEAWLDLSGFQASVLDGYGRNIAATVKQNTGIPVSVGIASTKVLAKIANRICKKWQVPGQCFNLGNEQALDEVLRAIAVGDVWGIGARWERRLKELGIENACQLRDADIRQMRKLFSVVMERLILELRGVNCLDFEAIVEDCPSSIVPKQQIIASRSFGERVETLDSLLQAVSSHVHRAAEKLRAQGSVCGAIQVSIRTGRHNPQEAYYGKSALVRLELPTADTRTLLKAASRIVRGIYQPGHRYAKAGVMLCDLSSGHVQQGCLFRESEEQGSTTLMAMMDQLNGLYGRNSIFLGCAGLRGNWQMKRDRVTPRYTTHWNEVPTVK